MKASDKSAISAVVGDFSLRERLRDHADHFAAAGKDCIGNDAHQPDVATAVDETDLARCQHGAHRLCGFAIEGLSAQAGAAVNTNPLHHHTRSSTPLAF